MSPEGEASLQPSHDEGRGPGGRCGVFEEEQWRLGPARRGCGGRAVTELGVFPAGLGLLPVGTGTFGGA